MFWRAFCRFLGLGLLWRAWGLVRGLEELDMQSGRQVVGEVLFQMPFLNGGRQVEGGVSEEIPGVWVRMSMTLRA